MKQAFDLLLGVAVVAALFAAACGDRAQPGGVLVDNDGAPVVCHDEDGDGYGQNCALGQDCDDADPGVTYECRDCLRPERGCPCNPAQAPQRCFDKSQEGEDGALICFEGTRYCRDGVYSACEDVHSYVAMPRSEQLAAINDTMTPETCDTCKVNCFVVKDPLDNLDGGVMIADGGGITLPPGEGGVASGGADAGVVTHTGGSVSGCTFGAAPDSDCDGIDDVFDELPTTPLTLGNDNHAIFFQLGPGDTGLAALQLGYQVRNADVYFLLDMSTTMSGERNNLISGLTKGNFYDPLSGVPADCPDLDGDGLPDNQLKTEGIVGAIRCLIGGAWIGTGYFRDVPYSPSGHDDEHLFRHLVDMTPDVDPVRSALQSMVTNANRDYPEAGPLALWSLATGKGQFFGVNRPAVAERLQGPLLGTPTGCPAGARGYPCFRDGPVPIVVLFTDDQFANGPGSAPSRNSLNLSSDRNTEGFARFTPASAESFDTANNVGDLAGEYFTLVGDTTRMRSDIPRSIMGCGTDTNAPDVVYRFVVPSGGPFDFRFDINDREDDNTPATGFDMAMSLFDGVPGVISAPIDVMDGTLFNINDGPDLTYLTYTGVTDGTNSARGFHGGLSGCGADGSTNQVVFTFQPSVDANIVLDAASSGFGSVISLHQGTPADLPSDPTPTPITNNNDEFSSARPIVVEDQYNSYVGNSGLSPSLINADYGSLVVGCGVNASTKDSVFKFDLSNPRRVRIDTEGSSFGTTISLHDGPPPDVQITTGVVGNDVLPGRAIGNVRGGAFELHSGGTGTGSLTADYTNLGCGSDDTTKDATFSFSVDQPTDIVMDISSPDTLDPVVAVYAALPGNLVTLDNAANANNDLASAFDIGDVLAQEEVRVINADTDVVGITAVYAASDVSCGAAGSSLDQVYHFTVGADTTVRARVTAPTWNAAMAVYAGSISAATRVGCDGSEGGIDVDVSAGVDYYIVVKGKGGAEEGAYTLDLLTLFDLRSVLDNSAGGNEGGATAFSLPDVYRSKVVVTNATTSGMAADFPVSALACGTDDQSPDAVYRFTSSLPTKIDITATGSGWTRALTLYDGPPPEITPVVNLNPGNANEDSLTAHPVDVSGVGERVIGDTSSMAHDVDASLLSCSAHTSARDATFSFTVSEPTEVNVSVPSSAVGAVLGLFQGNVPSAPASTTLENDTAGAADGNPSPSPNVTSNWLRFDADMGNLTASSAVAVAVDNSGNANPTGQTAFDVGDIYGRKVSVGGADTTAQSADYKASLMQCGGADSGQDAVYQFTTSVDTTVRAKLTPAAGFDATIALFDGGTDLLNPRYPQLASEVPVTYDLSGTNANEDVGNAQSVSIVPEETFLGDTSGMTSDLDGTFFDIADGTTCSAAASAPDAFFRFSLSATTDVVIDSAGSDFATTMALFDATAMPAAETSKTMENDTLTDAAGNPVGDVDARWHVLTGDLASLTNSGQSSSTVDNAANSNETGGSATSLGDVSGKHLTVTNGDTSGMSGDHVLSCGAHGGAADAVYTMTPTTDTTVRIRSTAGYTPVLAVYDGPPPIGFTYTPSNFDPKDSGINWAGAPDVRFNCGTSTFDSSGTGSFSNWCGNATPSVVIRSQSGGPDVAIVVLNSLEVVSGNTLRVTGSRPVIFAVYGDAKVYGTLDASSYSTGTGAGSDWSCGPSAGTNGVGSSSSGGGGGAGGGFGSNGGDGGYGDKSSNYGGSGGASRGANSMVPLLGGCNGGQGGGCTTAGGNGGGSVQISARSAVTVTGAIRANGEDGVNGCGSEGGGTGGGSGGAILLEGTSVAVSGSLTANGGRGGNGGSGGSGGAGSTSASSPGTVGQYHLTNGGGGGGGGYGRVRQNVGGSGPGVATELGCGSDSLELSLTGGTTYYLVVKGNNAADAGAYTLDLESAAADIPGCSEDRFAADAFFEFTVASDREVQLDTSGSSLDTVLALYDGSNNLLACDDDSAGSGDSRITQTLTTGTYHAVIKAKDGTTPGLPYQLQIRDNDGLGALDCADGAASTGGTIMRTLPAGDYVVAITGQTSDPTGKYSLNFRDLNGTWANWLSCDTASDELGYDVQAGHTYFVVVKGDGASEYGSYGLELSSAGAYDDLGCGADPSSSDAFYRFKLDAETRVRIDTIGSANDTVIGLFPAGTTTFDASNYAIDANGDPVGCDDGSGSGGASLIEADLVPGSYYVVVKSDQPPWAGGDLPFTLSIRDEGNLGAITCAPPGGTITQLVQPGSYTVVLSSDGPVGGAYEIRLANNSVVSSQTGSPVACADGNSLSADVSQGKDYYLVVKGDKTGDSGGYGLRIEDALSTAGAAGSTPIACTDSAGSLTATLPVGDYYAVVKGKAGSEGNYVLTLADSVALADSNRLACDDASGPNDTGAIEADLPAGSYWVVVKSDGPGDAGIYQLNVRDMDTVPDNRLACGGALEGSRIETSVTAGQDYTVVLKGQGGEQGAYNLKLYDADNLTGGGEFVACTNNNATLSATLDEGVYYLALKGDRVGDRGIFQVDMFNTTAPTKSLSYSPPVWSQSRSIGINGISEALAESGLVVLPVMSGGGSSAINQARALATQTGAVRADGTPIVKQINSNGSGLGSDLVSAVSELANNLALDVSVRAVFDPDAGAAGFTITPNPVPGSSGCDSTPTGSVQTNCFPGSTPQFNVVIQNPAGSPVPLNPSDPYGGYHFRLELIGNGKYVLDSVPVYIIPDSSGGAPAPGSVAMSGQFTRDLHATGCTYFLVEGESSADGACTDGVDNDGDGLIDRGIDTDMDGIFEIDPDPDCLPGTCSDGIDNDNDGTADSADTACQTNQFPNWSDLYYAADLPAGTKLAFEVCGAETEADLDGCTYGTVMTVTSNGATCVVDGDCLGQTVEGVTRDGFCTDTGTCQFIDPQTSRPFCTSDADCDNGNYQGFKVRSSCDTSANECVYTTGPGDVAPALSAGTQFTPYIRNRVTLYADPSAAQSPTLHDLWVTYDCTNAQ